MMHLSGHMPRVITGLILAASLVTSLLFGGLILEVVVAVVAVVALGEFYCMFWPGRSRLLLKAIGLLSALPLLFFGFLPLECRSGVSLAAFGLGSMVAALALPRVLERIPDRAVMLAGAAMLVAGTALGVLVPSYALLLVLWLVIGFGYSVAQTPSGRLLRRSAHPEDRPAIFAAQFALSHACWLLCYPLAGWLGVWLGLPATFAVMSLIGALGVVLALRLWPAHEARETAHDHPELAPDHPHLREHSPDGQHRHEMIIDDLHPRWRAG